MWAFARAVGEAALEPGVPVERLEALVDRWAASHDEVLSCAAVAAYGEAAAVRPDWFGDEVAKLHRAAGDRRRRVREAVAQALQRMLEADWDRTLTVLEHWASDASPLVVRAAAAAADRARPTRTGPQAPGPPEPG